MKQFFSIVIILSGILSACEKDKNNGEDSTPDVSGFWIVTETVTGNCLGEVYPQQETVIFKIEQSNENLIFTTYPAGDILTGKINGNSITMTGEFSGGSGNNAISFSGIIGDDGSTLTGTAAWEWYSDTYSCTGTATVTGEKAADVAIDYEGTWEGYWFSDEYGLSGTFTVDVEQNGNTLSGSIDVPEIDLVNARLQGEVHGNIVYFGDIEGSILFAGTAEDNTSSGEYTYPYFDDEGTWLATRIVNR